MAYDGIISKSEMGRREILGILKRNPKGLRRREIVRQSTLLQAMSPDLLGYCMHNLADHGKIAVINGITGMYATWRWVHD